MKFNRIIKEAAALCAAVFAFTACGDKFLTVENPTAQPIEEFFNTEAHLAEALVAAYDPLEWTDWSCGQYAPVTLLADFMADQIWVGGSDATDNQFWHLMANYEAIPTNCLSSIWTEFYSGVKRCNDAIKYIGWVENLNEDVAKSTEAQARLLRVYYYSWMWKFWGNIVYYETNLEAPYIGEQFTADEVYAKMMADLEGVISLGVLPMQWTGADQGRVSLAMAYMLYADLVMYQKDSARYGQALSYMKEIINSNKYDLNPDYTNIFTFEGEWSKESIFEINYKSENQVRSYDWTMGAGGTWLPQLISPSGYASDGYNGGWGFAPVCTATYEMFADGDTRRDATVFQAKPGYNVRYQDTGLWLEKYVAKASYAVGSAGAADCAYGNNFRMYRYAETLLNAAELALSSDATNAKTWLNKVHKRAGLNDEVEATLENIKQERRLEFVGEGKRYWDLIRWGDAAKVLVPSEDSNFTSTSDKGRHGSWSEAKKYLPIPQSEIDSSQNTLKQNDSY